jgi:hypothetical protein
VATVVVVVAVALAAQDQIIRPEHPQQEDQDILGHSQVTHTVAAVEELVPA